ncbi:MAG: hypothetical protein U1E56_02565 [Bauldia sp.]
MFHHILVLSLVAIAFLLALNVAPKGWRTALFNALAGIPVVGAVIADALGGFDWTRVLDGKAASWAGLAVIVLNVALRAMTTTPIGKED